MGPWADLASQGSEDPQDRSDDREDDPDRVQDPDVEEVGEQDTPDLVKPAAPSPAG